MMHKFARLRKMKSLKRLMVFFGFINMIVVHSQHLLNHHWENRVLIINVDCLSDRAYEEQLADLQINKESLLERKLIIYQIRGEKYKKGLEKNKNWLEIKGTGLQFIQENFNFALVLIGLDGLIKLKKSEILVCSELFNVIDVMPMRIQEMENLKQK